MMTPSYPVDHSFFLQTWIYTKWWCFHSSYSCSSRLLFKKIFFFIDSTRPPLFAPLYSGIMIWTNLNLYHLRVLPNKLHPFLPIGFWLQYFLKTFLCIFLYKISNLHCGSTIPQRIMIWTKFELYYQRMHPHELQFFLLVDFWEDFLKIPTILPFIILDCLPLKQGMGPLILTDLTPKNFFGKCFVPSLVELIYWFEEVENVKSVQTDRQTNRYT